MGVGRVDTEASVAVAERGLERSGVEAGVRRPMLGVLISGLADRGASFGGVPPDRS